MSEELEHNNEEELNQDPDSQEERGDGSSFVPNSTDTGETITRVTGMYRDWFLDYASYVILERAVPAIEDGFKPVQRRIMHSMKDLDDGRYNKVANIVGHLLSHRALLNSKDPHTAIITTPRLARPTQGDNIDLVAALRERFRVTDDTIVFLVERVSQMADT